MRVILANKFFFRNGGSEAVFFEERAFLISQCIEVADFSMEDPRNLDSNFNAFFVSAKSYRNGSMRPLEKVRNAISMVHSFESTSRLRKLIDSFAPDLMHCHNIYHQLTPSIMGIARKRGVRVVLTLHDYKPVCPTYLRLKHGTLCSDCIDGDFANVLKNRCAEGSLAKSALLYAEALFHKWARSYENADLVIAPSEFLAKSAAHRFDGAKLRVLRNGVDTCRITASTEDAGYVLYVGRLSAEKGVRTLLDAHRGLGTHIKLRVCGAGPLLETLRFEYPDVEFMGHKTGSELQAIMASASCIVVPSECYENCPMSILEAMAHGKPVVASSIGGIPELVEDGHTGLLFPPGDAQAIRDLLEGLMGDTARRRKLGAAARARAEREFSLRLHNKRLLELYGELHRS